MAVVMRVQLCVLSFQQVHLYAGQYGEDVPLQLKESKPLSRTQTAECHHRVLHLFAVFVELGVNESVVFELLQRENGT